MCPEKYAFDRMTVRKLESLRRKKISIEYAVIFNEKNIDDAMKSLRPVLLYFALYIRMGGPE